MISDGTLTGIPFALNTPALSSLKLLSATVGVSLTGRGALPALMRVLARRSRRPACGPAV